MTLLTPEHAASESENLLNSIIGSVQELRCEIEDLKEKVRDGEGLDKTRDGKTLPAAKSLLQTCQEVENRLVECRKKSAGIAQGGYALDLERARADIGRKLDRLRALACPGSVSE